MTSSNKQILFALALISIANLVRGLCPQLAEASSFRRLTSTSNLKQDVPSLRRLWEGIQGPLQTWDGYDVLCGGKEIGMLMCLKNGRLAKAAFDVDIPKPCQLRRDLDLDVMRNLPKISDVS